MKLMFIKTNYKFYIVSFLLIIISSNSIAQTSYVHVCETDTYEYYINKNVTKTNGLFYVWIKNNLIGNVFNERESISKMTGGIDCSDYYYNLSLCAIDLSGIKYKNLRIIFYNGKGSPITSISDNINTAEWEYVVPGTCMEEIFLKLKDIISKKK